ncbi:HRDC domain-containing protein [Corynebacterium sp. PCR 32]|uniref:HRDC domain-containing protein n=1 Tax=Corynebacterium sp. PCR 32 TaxID=3351342 RepID=UPI0037526051
MIRTEWRDRTSVPIRRINDGGDALMQYDDRPHDSSDLISDELGCCDWYLRSTARPLPSFPLLPESTSTPVSAPSCGVPPLLTTREHLHEAASVLKKGQGPVAIDTERASAYRYDDRAFLLQVKRAGSGLFLIDAEACRPHMKLLAPVLNPLTWIIHSARTDLPALFDIGLIPRCLFDTEMGGRIAGLERVNLADMVNGFVGYRLAKGYGKEDWSRRPLPPDWLNYAALDVEYLLDLFTALSGLLAELERFSWWKEECAFIRSSTLAGSPSISPSSRIKGLHLLSTAAQRTLAAALWNERDRRARSTDRSPHRILSNTTLIAIARKDPATIQELTQTAHFQSLRQARPWWETIHRARQSTTPPSIQLTELPQHLGQNKSRASGAHRTIATYDGGRRFPQTSRGDYAQRLYSLCSQAIKTTTKHTGITHDVVISPHVVRLMAWHFSCASRCDAADIDEFFAQSGVRRWQRRIATPVCADALSTWGL